MKKALILVLILWSIATFCYAESYTVNVPDQNGGYKAIVIVKENDYYIGPSGERYLEFPTVSKLQMVYGLNQPNPHPGLQATVQTEQMLMNQMQATTDAMQRRQIEAQQKLDQMLEDSNKKPQTMQKGEQVPQNNIQPPLQNKPNTQSNERGRGNALVLPIFLVGFLIYWSVKKYNNFVQSRESVRNAFNQISVHLKRRHDLIPNLVEATKGYMDFEKGTLEGVMRARQTAVTAGSVQDKMKAENTLTNSLRGLYAVVENYPNLKANEDVLNLQEQLTRTENNISFARQSYNNYVMTYNVNVQRFPDSIVAAMGHFEKAPFFQGEEQEAKTPQVNLKN